MAISGTGFLAGATKVRFGKATLIPQVESPAKMTVKVGAELIARAAELPVVALNPAPGGGESAEANKFTASNPIPALSAIAPNNAFVGSMPISVSLKGKNFVATSRAKAGEVELKTSFRGENELAIELNRDFFSQPFYTFDIY